MQISPITMSSGCLNISKNSDNNVLQNTLTQSTKSDVFISDSKQELKQLKKEDGKPRFNFGELREIKKLTKEGNLDTATVTAFADTSLDVKSMGEIYTYGKNVENRSKEYSIIHEKIKEYDKNISNKDERTKFIADKTNDGKPAYVLKDARETTQCKYSENNTMHWNFSSKANPNAYSKTSYDTEETPQKQQDESNDLISLIKKYIFWLP